jgi:hypothetical protein
MSSELFKRLRENAGVRPDTSDPSSRYSFGAAGYSPLRERPGTTPTMSALGNAKPAEPRRTTDGDRPHAYLPPEAVSSAQPQQPQAQQPPAVRQREVIQEFEPPTFTEILKDLGLRIVEVGFAAAALAVGQEIAYFFTRRRFYTDEQIRRREW